MSQPYHWPDDEDADLERADRWYDQRVDRESDYNTDYKPMMTARYLENLLQQCSEERFGQDAIEHAVMTGAAELSYNLEADVTAIMARYDEHCEAYHKVLNERYLAEGVKGLLEEILRPLPLAMQTPALERAA